MKKLLKFTFIFILVLPLISFLQTGLNIGINLSTFLAIFFSLIFTLSLFFRGIRQYILIISAMMVAGMAPFVILNQMDLANLLGSTGIGLILLLLLSYLPDFIKKGYIEKL